jgi:transcriptional regulator with XRE-family HTH domain
MNSFGKRLAELRDGRGLTQKQLADKLKLAQSTIASWETGVRDPNSKMITKLAEFFDVPTDRLLARTYHTPSYKPISADDAAEGYDPEEPTDDEESYIKLEELLSRVTDPHVEGVFRKRLRRYIDKELQSLREMWSEDIECTPFAILTACEGESTGIINEFIAAIERAENEYQQSKSRREQRDIAKELEQLMASLDSNNALAFDGEPLTEEDKELLRASLEHSLRTARIVAKQKFTPKKYRK